MEQKPSFSRREWLFVISIVLMIEAWILNISYSFKADQDVINYISFASTIASLLLAVLAIIYGFYQADGQHKLASTINFQLDSMRSVQSSLNRAAEGLDGQLTQIASATSTLGTISNSIESTHTKLSSLEGGVTNLQSQQALIQAALRLEKVNPSTRSVLDSADLPASSAPPPASVASNAPASKEVHPGEDGDFISRKAAFRRIIGGTSYPHDLVGYAFYHAIKTNGSESLPYYDFVNFFSVGMAEGGVYDYEQTRWFDLFRSTMGMLEIIGVISTSNLTNNYKNRTFSFRKDYIEQLKMIAMQTAKAVKTASGAAMIDKLDWKMNK
ncbi:hypothetical protein D3C86_1292820 [compost metagenome]